MLARTPLPDLLTVDNFAAWLRCQPPAREYCFAMSEHCAVALFMADHGFANPHVTPRDARDGMFGERYRLPDAIARAVAVVPWTFGAALARLEAVT